MSLNLRSKQSKPLFQPQLQPQPLDQPQPQSQPIVQPQPQPNVQPQPQFPPKVTFELDDGNELEDGTELEDGNELEDVHEPHRSLDRDAVWDEESCRAEQCEWQRAAEQRNASCGEDSSLPHSQTAPLGTPGPPDS